MIRRLVPGLVASLLSACGASTTAPAADAGHAALTYYEHIKPLVDRACARCHVAGGIAPFPLTTYAEVAAYAGIAKLAITQRTMPPRGSTAAPLRASRPPSQHRCPTTRRGSPGSTAA
jgi:hypothetical protein